MNKLSPKEKIGYSLGDAACHIVFDNVMFYMMFFYTDIFGIPAAFVGTLFLLARGIDAISDPIMGILADRTRSRWGKFRPYILWGAIPFGIICTLTYLTPDLGSTGKLIYASITYVLLTLTFTAVNIPYCALGDVITMDPKQRMSLQSWRFVLSGITGMLSTVLLMPLVHLFGGDNRPMGFAIGMAVLSLIAVIMLFLCFFWTKERLRIDEFSGEVLADFKRLFSNGPWAMVGLLTIFNIMQWSIRGGAMMYYVSYFVGNANLFSVFLGTYSVGSIIGVALAKPLSARIGKVALFGWLNALLCVASVVFFFVPAGAISVMFVLIFIVGLLHQMMTPIQWVMISDAVDFGEWKEGRRLTGISFAGMLFLLKLGLAFSGALIGWTLSGIGYQANVPHQSPGALMGILVLFSLAPAAIYLASLLAVQFYPLKGAYFESITDELAKRRLQAGTL